MLLCIILFIFSLSLHVSGDLTVQEYEELIKHYVNQANNYEYPEDATSFVNGTYDEDGCELYGNYDFIIVGAGSSGTVLANRLSEVEKWNVLLLEAGGDENAFTDIPNLFSTLWLSEFNWGYKSVPQKYSMKGFINNVDTVPRGKGLGGSSLINAMMYVRGNKLDFDKWGKENPGWSYDEALKYFKKSENSTLDYEDEGYHGHNGSLHVEYVNKLTPFADTYLQAQKELGREILDYNGKNEMGFSRLQTTTINGRRCSGAKAFLKPIKYRKNLEVLTYAYVTKVLIHDNVVYGVKFMNGGKTFCAYTTTEVILSAGAINTPHILMHSGIGPKAHLEEVGIDVVKDLPVGQNMWDHICLKMIFFNTNLTIKDYSQEELIEQYLKGTGLYTTPDSIQDIGFETLHWQNKEIPDIEFIMRVAKVPKKSYETYEKLLNINKDVYEGVYKKAEGKVSWQSLAVLLNPISRGNITLKSNNPFDFPLINPNYFSDPEDSDVNTMAAAIKDMMKVSNTTAMQKYNSSFIGIDLPNCRNLSENDLYVCWARHLANTLYHFSGTTKMGAETDGSSVVDPELKVHGITGLRVADCSVIPVTISGHTNAPAFMIGEKAADIIKKDWPLKTFWNKYPKKQT